MLKLHSSTLSRSLILVGLSTLLSSLSLTQASLIDDDLETIASWRHVSVEDVMKDTSAYTQSIGRISEAEARAGNSLIGPPPSINATWSGISVNRTIYPGAISASDRRRQAYGPVETVTEEFQSYWDWVEPEPPVHHCGTIACPYANAGIYDGLSVSTEFSLSLSATFQSVIVAAIGVKWTTTTSEGFSAEVSGGRHGEEACCKRLWTSRNIQHHQGTMYQNFYVTQMVNGRPAEGPTLVRTERTDNIIIKSGGLNNDGWLGYTAGSTACWDESAGCGNQVGNCNGQC
jgi:hypothetical protein